ncbi:hypothetical protein [Streptomyces sp. NPDC094458]|uniref:hypothetical protein n=1 Tax=Streptomyces sp. NPDC094458 TaxID=3155208 RepID=UPI00331EAB26
MIEVNRPDKAERRRIGKSDPIDAHAAARAALSGRASVIPKDDTVSGRRARPAVISCIGTRHTPQRRPRRRLLILAHRRLTQANPATSSILRRDVSG